MTTTFLRRGIGVALALILTAGHAVSQQGRPALDPNAVPQLRAELDRAARLGLNVAPHIAMARHGDLASRSTRTIRDALHELTDRLVTARAALDPVQNDAELTAGAEAIRAGVTDAVLRDLRSVQRTRSLTVPLGVLQELIAQNVPMKTAAAQVKGFLKNNTPDVQIAAVGRDLPALIAQGLAPSVALDVRSKGVLSLPQALPQGPSVAPTTIKPPPR